MCLILLETWEEAFSSRFPMLAGVEMRAKMASLGTRQRGGHSCPGGFLLLSEELSFPMFHGRCGSWLRERERKKLNNTRKQEGQWN